MLGTLRFQRRRHSMCHLAFEFDRMHLSIFFSLLFAGARMLAPCRTSII